jgi:hypothetical protein
LVFEHKDKLKSKVNVKDQADKITSEANSNDKVVFTLDLALTLINKILFEIKFISVK